MYYMPSISLPHHYKARFVIHPLSSRTAPHREDILAPSWYCKRNVCFPKTQRSETQFNSETEPSSETKPSSETEPRVDKLAIASGCSYPLIYAAASWKKTAKCSFQGHSRDMPSVNINCHLKLRNNQISFFWLFFLQLKRLAGIKMKTCFSKY